MSKCAQKKQGAATIVFARKLIPVQHDRYERWIGRVAGGTSDFAGYGGTTLLRPAPPGDANTAIVHFDTAEILGRWLNSDERKRCLKDLETIGIESEEVTPLAGRDH